MNRWWSTCTRWAEKIRDVRQRTDAQEGKGGGDVVDFQVEVRKHAATEKAGRIKGRIFLLFDCLLADKFGKDRPILLLPGPWSSGQHEPEYESAGWWQKPTRRVGCTQCTQCEVVKEFVRDFHAKQLGRGGKYISCKRGVQNRRIDNDSSK